MPIRTLDKKQRKAEGNCKANARASLLADQGKTFAMGLQQGHRMEKTQMFLPRVGQTEEEMEGRQAESQREHNLPYFFHVTAHKAGNSHGLLTAF